ncbi:MAG: hypothetical protein H6662_10635 [Ardenticatenaceae bacterium]|nr:hypothetical protein [Anaerolineales bacterium]MCB8922031.1 hypothetical protein [Ardenticatenaceae bacterium]MCB8989607.1 hypothetical protein [Ardenticatenaceae bacterium]MCB9003150.1 hypothetical protein [Ardenticatenaceae bacterium]
MDAEFTQLIALLRTWHGRKQRRDLLLWGPRGLLAGLLLAVVLATVARLRPFLDNAQVGYTALILGVVGLLVTLIVMLARRATPLQQARFADRQFGLRERASTAVEISQGVLTVPAPLAQQQLVDALQTAVRVDAKAGLPFSFVRRDWLMILLAVVVLGAAVLLPNPQETALKQSRAVRQSIEEQVQALEALEQEILNNPELSDEEREELLDPIQNALESLDPGSASQEQTVATLSEAEAELRALGEQLSTDNLQQRLQEAGQPLADNQNAGSLGNALQNGQLSQAGAAMAQLADNLPDLSVEEQAQLAQDLAETAQSLQDVDSELAQQLADAAAALQDGDVAAAQQALQQASGTLQQRAQQSAAAQQAQSAAGQLQQGRQAVAQAGQQGQSSQPGQSGQSGQSSQQGQQGQGQGQGSGQGQGQDSGNGSGQGSGSEQGTGTGGPGPGGGHAENVFVPDLVDLSGETGIDVELPAECIANPAQCGGLLSETPTEFTNEGSTVPYNQVFGDYRDAAYEALSDDYIPLGMKGYIRDYFSSLEP